MRTELPHAYTPSREADAWEWSPCRYCKHGPGAPIHLLELPGVFGKQKRHAAPAPEDVPEAVQPDRTNQLSMF